MRIDGLFSRQCQECPNTAPPPCNCPSSASGCILINRTCEACSFFKCVADKSSSSGSSGPSKGAMAGGIVAGLILLAIAGAGIWWYRKRSRRPVRAAHEVKDIPASAATVLSRPDPAEKPSEPGSIRRMYSTSSSTTIDLDPQAPKAVTPGTPIYPITTNPFDDNNSIQTTGTEGTNVIPIALVSPDGHASATGLGPPRPVRSPDLNLEHTNVSDSDSARPTNYATSQISGISAMTANRNSYMTSASYSSFLNEAPMIITPTSRNVRQVLGVHKAEFINTSGINSGSDGLKPPPAHFKRPSTATSPLASTAFTPSDVIHENRVSQASSNPFDDENMSTMASPSTSTFGQLSPGLEVPSRDSTISDMNSPVLPWARHTDSRPSSMSTQAGSIIMGIDTARRVNLGYSQATTATEGQRSPYRTTMGRLVSPSSAGSSNTGTLEQQQQDAIAHARARAREQGLDESRRASGSSFMSAITHADSILESFPFVPPSPISNLPMRSPPVSPLAQQSFSQPMPPQEKAPLVQQRDESDDDALPPPPNRRTLGLSTGSQFSTASSGLGSFPFQIDSGNTDSPNASARQSTAPSAFSGRQRASLDTLALTSDLASYPLAYDRDPNSPYAAKQ